MKKIFIISLLIISFNKSFSQTYLITRIDDRNTAPPYESVRYIGNVQSTLQARYDANYQKISNAINHIKQRINELPFDFNTRKTIETRFVNECLKNVEKSGINMTSNSNVLTAINYMYDTVNAYVTYERMGKIGVELDKEYGYITISNIIYGSSAWKSSQLKTGDVIVKVGEYGGYLTDVRGMNTDEVINLIRGQKYTKVTLVVRRSDGSINNITTTRE